jgi:flavin-dependent dehydrogenase
VQAIDIGGSTAGRIAAGVLARSGLSVVLIDKALGAKPQWEHVQGAYATLMQVEARITTSAPMPVNAVRS